MCSRKYLLVLFLILFHDETVLCVIDKDAMSLAKTAPGFMMNKYSVVTGLGALDGEGAAHSGAVKWKRVSETQFDIFGPPDDTSYISLVFSKLPSAFNFTVTSLGWFLMLLY